MARHQSTWLVLLFYGFFITDSMNWIGAFNGMDIRLSYLLLALGLVLAVVNGNLRIPKILIWLTSLMCAASLLTSGGRSDLITAMLMQMAGIAPFSLLAYHVARSLTLLQAARIYLTIAKVISVAILFEHALFLVGGQEITNMAFFLFGGISPGYIQDNGILRAAGFLYEPSQVGLLLPPALYLAIKLQERFAVKLIILGAIGSFSSLAFAGLVIAIILANFSIRRLLFLLPFLAIFSAVATQVPAVNERLEWFAVAIFSESEERFGSENVRDMRSSVGTSVANSLVAYNGLLESPFIGHGLGSFKVLFPEIIGDVIPGAEMLEEMLVPGQGKSLLIRLVFEFGLFGLGMFLFFFARRWNLVYKVRHDAADCALRFYWATAVIIFFIIYMIRKETYVAFYIWFFFFMFVIATKSAPKVHKENRVIVPQARMLAEAGYST